MPHKKNSSFNAFRIAMIFISLAILIAVVALAGWVFKLKSLTNFGASWPNIKVNTAIGIMLSGISLLLYIRKKTSLALVLAFIVFLFGFLSFSEYVFDWDANIDEMLFPDKNTDVSKYPGRMAVLTTFAVMLAGVSLVTHASKRKGQRTISTFASVLLLIMSFTGFLAALYNARQLSQSTNLSSFSIPSALAGLFISIAILISKQNSALMAVFYKQTTAARAGIKGILIIIAVLILIGWFCLQGEKYNVFSSEMALVVMITTFTICFLIVIRNGINRLNSAEYKLKGSKEDLRRVLSSTADVFYVVDRDYRITLINEMAEKNLTIAWGRPVGVDSKILDLIPGDKNEPIKESFEKVFKGEKIEYELRSVLHQNLPEWVLVSYKPVFDDDGSVIGAYIVTKDITHSKKTEEELKQTNNRFEMITRTTNDAIWEWDLESGQLWSNEMHQHLYGLTQADPVPSEDRWIERIHPDDRQRMINRQAEALGSGHNVFISEYRFNVEAIGYRNIYDRCYIVRNDIGKPIRMVGSMMDVTEQKKIENALVKSENHLRTIVQAEPECVKLVNRNGELEDMNPAGLNMIEADNLEQVKGQSLSDIIKEPYRRSFESLRQNVFQGKSGMLEFEITGLKGRSRWLETHAVPLKDGSGKIVSLLGVTRDITDRKKAEEEVQQSYIAIRKLTEHLQNIREEERTHIAREIHDELGQQLTVLKMDASWLNKKLSSADENVKQKLQDLLELLDVTVRTVRKISSELRPSLLDDMGLVAAMEWHLKEFERRSAVQTSFMVPANDFFLPDTKKTGLFRIFQESLTNVARHADAKKVEVQLQQQNGNIILSIKDDGKGFDKEKVVNKKTLGILGMEERSFMMGGSYQINSKPDEGTLVVVSVPNQV